MDNTQQEYIVSLEGFEGPLDLLHQLIEKRKLQINTISLAQVTADYMAHIRAPGDGAGGGGGAVYSYRVYFDTD